MLKITEKLTVHKLIVHTVFPWEDIWKHISSPYLHYAGSGGCTAPFSVITFFGWKELAYAIGNVVERRQGENMYSQTGAKIRGFPASTK